MSYLIKYQKTITAFFIFIFFSTLIFSIYRDYLHQKESYPCDLRKRIVGARYMAKGYSPYFFKWTPAYPPELCIQYEGDSTFKQNIVTLPPGYTWLLQPLASLAFPVIEKIWFAFQYVSLLIIFSVFYFTASNKTSRNLLLLLYSLLLLSKAWIMNVYIGQSYIIFPLLLSLAYIIFRKQSNVLFFYGVTISICIWLRPSCIFFIFPFLFSENRRLFFKGLFIMGAICLLQIILCKQYNNWIDFFKSSANWIDYYSQRNFDHGAHFDKLVVPAVIETQTNFYVHPLPGYIANVPFEFRAMFNIYASNLVYGIIFITFIGALTFILLFKKKIKDPTMLLLIGFCFNYLSEIFLWVPKCDYYFVELFFPLCVLIYNHQKLDTKILILIFTGLFFCAYFFKVVPMQLLIGEYLIACSIFLFIFSSAQKFKSYQNYFLE